MFFNSVFQVFCLFVYLFVLVFAVVLYLSFGFIQDISLDSYVIEAVRLSGFYMILVILWKA